MDKEALGVARKGLEIREILLNDRVQFPARDLVVEMDHPVAVSGHLEEGTFGEFAGDGPVLSEEPLDLPRCPAGAGCLRAGRGYAF